jgi:hypothetical protein
MHLRTLLAVSLAALTVALIALWSYRGDSITSPAKLPSVADSTAVEVEPPTLTDATDADAVISDFEAIARRHSEAMAECVDSTFVADSPLRPTMALQPRHFPPPTRRNLDATGS